MGEMLRDNINFFALILLFISSILYIATLLINSWIQHKKEKTALLLGKRGSFKCEGKTLTGKVKYTCEDLCCVYVEVDGKDGLYVIKSKNFNPLDNKKGGE